MSQQAVEDEDAEDRSAQIAALFGAYHGRLISFVRRRMKSADEAADIVQETFARLARVDSVATIAHPRAFLFKTALNLLRDDTRKHQVRSGQAETLAVHLYDEVATPERVVAGRQCLQRFERALAELNPRTREIFLLARYERQPQAQIAAQFGLSVSAIEKHIMRAMLHLDRAMEDEP